MSRFKLPQTITYWLPGVNNGTGGITWGAGTAVDARIANISKTIFTDEGKQIMATKAVYTRVNIPVGSYVIEGDQSAQASPEGVSGTQLVIQSSDNTSMTDMNKALL